MRLYNELSHKLEVDKTEPLNERAKLDTGTHCNYRCEFCYYKTQLDEVTEFNVIKDRIDYLVACGMKEVDLSGGESSIHKQWFDILDYCKSKGLKVSTLSNGYKFANKEFLQKSKDHGLEEILFSVHGYDKDSHNILVGHRKGFENIVEAIKNAHELGILVRINCTVTHKNYKSLPTKFVALVQELKPYEVNFLTLNYWDDAGVQETIDYSEVTPYVHQAIDSLKDFVEIINVRYTPYCFMKGYEQYVCNYYQHIYDVYDWNIAVYNGDMDPTVYRADPYKAMYEAAAFKRNRTYYKKQECLKCKYYFICDGVEKQIKEVELRPEPGEQIKQVNFYRKDWYAKKTS
jgi:radical SAM protein with 4Fe4S-binding SPASM domain